MHMKGKYFFVTSSLEERLMDNHSHLLFARDRVDYNPTTRILELRGKHGNGGTKSMQLEFLSQQHTLSALAEYTFLHPNANASAPNSGDVTPLVGKGGGAGSGGVSAASPTTPGLASPLAVSQTAAGSFPALLDFILSGEEWCKALKFLIAKAGLPRPPQQQVVHYG